jgi:hypothetical protein
LKWSKEELANLLELLTHLNVVLGTRSADRADVSQT